MALPSERFFWNTQLLHNFSDETRAQLRALCNQFLREEVEAAGVKLVDEGKFLRDPNYLRDKNTSDSPQPKDEFVLKFVKP